MRFNVMFCSCFYLASNIVTVTWFIVNDSFIFPEDKSVSKGFLCRQYPGFRMGHRSSFTAQHASTPHTTLLVYLLRVLAHIESLPVCILELHSMKINCQLMYLIFLIPFLPSIISMPAVKITP